MSWKNTMEQMPTKDGQYLTAKSYTFYDHGVLKRHVYYEVCEWANNLRDHSFDFDDVEYEHSGFYYHDPEWGAIEDNRVEAWMEIEEYEP